MRVLKCAHGVGYHISILIIIDGFLCQFTTSTTPQPHSHPSSLAPNIFLFCIPKTTHFHTVSLFSPFNSLCLLSVFVKNGEPRSQSNCVIRFVLYCSSKSLFSRVFYPISVEHSSFLGLLCHGAGKRVFSFLLKFTTSRACYCVFA